ncbi:hypothetical protein G9A89_000018, partial [Geosiphon pyriformis]
LKRNVDQPAQTVIITANGMKKTPVGKIDNFLFTLNGITISVKVLVMDASQYQALVRNDWLQKANAKLDWKIQELQISYQGRHKASVFKFEKKEEKPVVKTFMALRSTSNWAEETEQTNQKPLDGTSHILNQNQKNNAFTFYSNAKIVTRNFHQWKLVFHLRKNMKDYLIKRSGKWDGTPCFTCEKQLSDEYNWINVAFKGGVCNQTCQYALFIAEKVKHGTPFNAAYNSVLNKLYHYPHDAKMIYELAMVLINGGTKEDVLQMKKAKYIKYTLELARFNNEDKIEVYHQIASHTYLTQEAQIQ